MSVCSLTISASACSREWLQTRITICSKPSLQLYCSLMIWLNKHQRAIITRVQTLTSIVRYSCILDSQDLTNLKIEHTRQISPKCHLNLEARLISKLNVSSLLCQSSLQRDISNLTDVNKDTNNINSLLLDDILDTFQVYERETLLLDGAVLFSLDHVSVLIKSKTVVIFYGGELFIGKFNLPVWEQIDLVLF